MSKSFYHCEINILYLYQNTIHSLLSEMPSRTFNSVIKTP